MEAEPGSRLGHYPPAVEALTRLVDDLCLGYKLPGAGGGGYLYMVAKDEDAAARIRRILSENRPNDKARFVEMSLCQNGFQVSRSYRLTYQTIALYDYGFIHIFLLS